MKPKKNPKTDLNRNRGLYFVMGLCLVMALAYVALEWKSYDTTSIYDTALNVDPLLDEEVPLILLKTLPPPPAPVAPTEIDIVEDDDPIEETVIETTEVDDETEILLVDDVVIVDKVIEDEVPFSVIENVPVFPGCENETDKKACFQSMMQKHVQRTQRYPEAAVDIGAEGRVSVMFTIQKDGSISNVKMRGPHQLLEKEAARIIGKLPKMTPGKQRGRAVRVPFSIPITFKLQ